MLQSSSRRDQRTRQGGLRVGTGAERRSRSGSYGHFLESRTAEFASEALSGFAVLGLDTRP